MRLKNKERAPCVGRLKTMSEVDDPGNDIKMEMMCFMEIR
jgi:hypothetical protein